MDEKKLEDVIPEEGLSEKEIKAVEITAQMISDLIMAARIPVNQITVGALGMVLNSYGTAVLEHMEKTKSATTLYTASNLRDAVRGGSQKIILTGDEK